jgi:tight adherence protein B
MRRVVVTRGGRARVRAAALATTPAVSSGERLCAAVVSVLGRGWARLRRVLLGDPDQRSIESGLPVALEGTARGLRAGASLRDALADAASTVPEPLRAELAAIARDAKQGGSLTEALDRWGALRRQRDVRLAAAALALVAETGGAPARTLDAVAATLRERSAVEREVRALATQARASAGVVAVAPLVFVAMMALVDPSTGAFLLGTRAGLLCLTAGLVLDGAGGLWMRQITRSVR